MESHKREFRSCNGQPPVQGPERLAGESSRREHMDVDPTQTATTQLVGSDEAQDLLVLHEGHVRECFAVDTAPAKNA